MNRKITALLVSTALAAFTFAEETPVPKLKQGDVEHFLKTYPEVSQQLEDLGMEYETKSGDYSIPGAIQHDSKFKAILKKHGWDENFFSVIGTIFQGYSILVYKNEIPKMNQKVAKAIQEIESNTAMSEAMKKQLIEQMKATTGIMAGQQTTMEQNIHPKDLELIQPHLEALKELLEDNQQE